jgi:two-component system, chemotaxis family, chemotaxis protein CheY
MALNFLIVDDSKILRGMVRRILGMTGLDIGDVHEAGSGKEALELLAQNHIDVVLADLNMPEMSGTELVERIRKSPTLSRTHVVIISSERAQATVENLKQLGVHAYLTKPFRAEALRDVLSTLPGNAGVPNAN